MKQERDNMYVLLYCTVLYRSFHKLVRFRVTLNALVACIATLQRAGGDAVAGTRLVSHIWALFFDQGLSERGIARYGGISSNHQPFEPTVDRHPLRILCSV